MFGKEDNTYNEIRDKSISQWLEALSQHDDIEVRGGTSITKGYIEDLKKTIIALEDKNTLKDKYLKKLKMAKNEENR